MKNEIFYWAYGSNLNIKEMAKRCPGARPFQELSIPNGALIFRGVADAIYRDDSIIHGGLWRINRNHEETLDAYEGVRSGLYQKCYLKLMVNRRKVSCLYYQMLTKGIYPPSDHYVDRIAQGYRDFGLPIEALDMALQEAWSDKKPTEKLIERHAKRGGKLARELSCLQE